MFEFGSVRELAPLLVSLGALFVGFLLGQWSGRTSVDMERYLEAAYRVGIYDGKHSNDTDDTASTD